MKICKKCSSEMNTLPFCTFCGERVSIETTPGKDDLNRIVSLYGPPDRDSGSDYVPEDSPPRRNLEYTSAGILFTFTPEQTQNDDPRWSLQIITDIRTHYALTAYAAAHRLLR